MDQETEKKSKEEIVKLGQLTEFPSIWVCLENISVIRNKQSNSLTSMPGDPVHLKSTVEQHERSLEEV